MQQQRQQHSHLWDRIGAGSGIVFVGIVVAGSVITGENDAPGPDAPASTIARYLESRHDESQMGATVVMLGIAAFLVFITYLRRRLEHSAEHASDSNWLPGVAWAGGLLAAVSMLLFALILTAQETISNYGADAQVAKTLHAFSWNEVNVLAPGLAVLVAATSLVTLRHRGLPTWIGWAGLPLVLILIFPFTTWIGFLLFLPWTLAVSTALLLRAPKQVTDRMTSSVSIDAPASA
jgi:hypothetical protein